VPLTAPPQVILDEAPEAATQAIGRTAMRKATLRLIPLIALGYGAAFIDRVNISFAALQMNHDLHFSATVYGFGAGLFFLSYAACEVPSNLLLYRFGARRWLARIMITWGLLAIGMLFVKTPLQFYVMRFLLGMAEAGFFPGVIFYLMQWFPAELRARCISRFYISLPLSFVCMGALAGVLLNLNGRLGLAGWQWLFLVEGLPAILLGIVYFLYLPDGPAHAKWLTQDERHWIILRLQQSSTDAFTHNQPIARALLNPRVWQVGIFMMLMLASSYAYAFSAPDIVQKVTGLSITKVGFVVAGINLLGVPAMLLNAMHSDRTHERYWHIIPGCLLMSAGFIVCSQTTSPWMTISALAVIIVGFNSMQGPLWALPAAFFTGRTAAAGIAAMNTIGIIGGFIGPYWMGFAKELTGDYQRGLLVASVPMLIAAGIMLFLYRRQTTQPIAVHPTAHTM
jgi:ACS family tartrate transporter-like MFS transporter